MGWVDAVDLSKISDENRHRVLEHLVSRLGRGRVQEALGVSRVTIWRLLSRQQRIDDEKLRTLLL